MPDFKTSMTPNGTPDLAFDTLAQGLSEFCKTAPGAFCETSRQLAELARAELAAGNEQASYEALNRLYIKFQHFKK